MCRSDTGAADYCGPLAYQPLPARLFRNRGDGSFEDVTAASQIGRARGNGLGVIAVDLDGDDWIDLYVADDEQANFLWINQGDGTFARVPCSPGARSTKPARPRPAWGATPGITTTTGISTFS